MDARADSGGGINANVCYRVQGPALTHRSDHFLRASVAETLSEDEERHERANALADRTDETAYQLLGVLDVVHRLRRHLHPSQLLGHDSATMPRGDPKQQREEGSSVDDANAQHVRREDNPATEEMDDVTDTRPRSW